MQTDATLKEHCKDLAEQVAEQDVQLKNISSDLAGQTHACKHADHFLAASPSLECCLPVMPCICLPLGLTPTVHPSASHLDYVFFSVGYTRASQSQQPVADRPGSPVMAPGPQLTSAQADSSDW